MGLGVSAQWIGSCVGDNIFNLPRHILKKTEWYKYLTSVLKYLKTKDVSAIPFANEVWMWSYADSRGTEYTVHFDYLTSKVVVSVSYYPNYCNGISVSKGDSLQEADTKMKATYPVMKTYQTSNREGEIITIHGQYPA
jgi:hypothetical protein